MIQPVPLAEAEEEGLYGGKSASLSRAIRAGLPVPPGFALSVTAVDAVVKTMSTSEGGAEVAVEATGAGKHGSQIHVGRSFDVF